MQMTKYRKQLNWIWKKKLIWWTKYANEETLHRYAFNVRRWREKLSLKMGHFERICRRWKRFGGPWASSFRCEAPAFYWRDKEREESDSIWPLLLSIQRPYISPPDHSKHRRYILVADTLASSSFCRWPEAETSISNGRRRPHRSLNGRYFIYYICAFSFRVNGAP